MEGLFELKFNETTESAIEFLSKFEVALNKLRSAGEIVAFKAKLRYLLMKLPLTSIILFIYN